MPRKAFAAATDLNACARRILLVGEPYFASIVEATGIVIPREETAVRPDRPGLKVVEILTEPGDTVTAGQALARLILPDGGLTQVQASASCTLGNSAAKLDIG